MKKLLLIDSHSLLHRAFHALPPLTTPRGEPSNALYGVASMLIKILRDEAPDYVAVLRDRPEPTFRKEEYEAYKATRPKAADELVSQLSEAPRLFESFGLKVFDAPGFEADDLIATLTRRFAGNECGVVILTGDMDTLQLVAGSEVVVKTPKRGVNDFAVLDEAAVVEKYGISPKRMTDYKALVGDPSDNIKGVPGVGPKTAAEIIRSYGNVEEFFREGNRNERLRKFMEFKEVAFRAKSLATLRFDVPVRVTALTDLAYPPLRTNLEEYFTRMGFKSLLARIGKKESPGDGGGEAPRSQKLF